MSQAPLYPFGYGLSYTSFEYSDLKISPSSIKAGDSAIVRIKVSNKGKLEGDEVIQLYIKDLFASVARPLKELKACRRIHLLPGESKELSFTITPEMLTILNLSLERAIEPGDFRILIGASSKDIRLRCTLSVK